MYFYFKTNKMSEVAFLAISALTAASVYYRRLRNTRINDLIIKL